MLKSTLHPFYFCRSCTNSFCPLAPGLRNMGNLRNHSISISLLQSKIMGDITNQSGTLQSNKEPKGMLTTV